VKNENIANGYESYFSHLKSISFFGRVYKRFFTSPILYFYARSFGKSILEVGSGTGSGVLGAFPKTVSGLEINPASVAYCKSRGLSAQLIDDDGIFPFADGTVDVCILDNVLEHIEIPEGTLSECYRVTSKHGGLVIVVPGILGYSSDRDHKKFYAAAELTNLDPRWSLLKLFSLPFFITSEILSRSVRQYCLVAVYAKINSQ
jgi:SAM-dependent methyltransferase